MTFKKLPAVLKSNFHFVWLILFFIINGYNDQRQAIPLSHLFILFIQIAAFAFASYWLFLRILKSARKAGIYVSTVLILVLFFGVFQDALGLVQLLAFISSLAVFLFLVLASAVGLFMWIKFSKHAFEKFPIFLNFFFLVCLVLELGSLVADNGSGRRRKTMLVSDTICHSCTRPDVYLILLDEYFGSTALREYYGFENSDFETLLKEQGFTVLSNTRGNYDLTLFSMASMLNMDYVKNVGELSLKNRYAYTIAMEQISSGEVIETFRRYGYQISNQSRFHLKDAESVYTGLNPSKIQLINSKTLYYRAAKFLPFFLARHTGFNWLEKRIEDETISDNEKILVSSLQEASVSDTLPIFTYVHLYMPHEPFAFDSSGRAIPFEQSQNYTREEKSRAYLQYLVYTNKRIGDYIVKLMSLKKRKAVILLMSDHGYRNLVPSPYKDVYQTLNAVYIPGHTPSGWYDGMTNVNQFRILFNTLFNTRLPILKDSVIKAIPDQ